MANKGKYLVPLLLTLYSGLSLLFLRNLLFASGTVGHNWDWYIPPLPEYLRSGFKEIFSSWSEHSLGHPVYLGRSLVYAPLYALGFMGVDGQVASKIVLFCIPVLSSFFAFLAIRRILNTPGFRGQAASALGGLLYGFSGSMFQWLVAGSLPALVGFALVPLSVFVFENFLYALTSAPRLPLRPILSVSLVLSLLIFISLPNFMLTLSLFLIRVGLSQRLNRKLLLKSVAVISLLVGLSSSFSFGPYFWYLQAAPQYVDISSKGLNYTFAPSLPLEFVVAGFYARDIFLRSLPEVTTPLFLASSFGLVIVAVICLWLRRQSIRPDMMRSAATWSLVYILALGFSVGDKVLGPIVHSFYSLPGAIILRSFEYYVAFVSLSLAFMVALAFLRLPSILLRRRSTIIGSLIIVLMASGYLLPWVTGDLGASTRRTDFDGTLDVFQPQPDYTAAFRLIAADQSSFNILVLPMTAAPYYQPTDYQRRGYPVMSMRYVGPEPTILNSLHGMLTRDDTFGASSDTKGILDSLANHLETGRLSPVLSNRTIIAANSLSEFWSLQYSQLGSSNYTKVDTQSTIIAGDNSLLLQQGPGEFGSAFLLHSFKVAQDWSRFSGISLYFFGRNDGSTYTLELRAPDADNRILYRFVDNFKGWKDALIDLDRPYAVVGSPQFSTIAQIRLWDFFSGNWYLGRLSLYNYAVMTPDQTRSNFLWALHYIDVKYVVVLKDVTTLGIWNASTVESFLQKTLKLMPVIDGQSVSLYQLPEPYAGTRVYVSTHPVLEQSSGLTDPLLAFAENAGTSGASAIALKDESNASAQPSNATVTHFEERNPSEYRLEISAEGPFFLVLLQQFDPLWTVTIDKRPSGVSVQRHFEANGYANGWYITGKGNISLRLIFELQSVFDISAAVSLVAMSIQMILFASLSLSSLTRDRIFEHILRTIRRAY